MNAPILPGSLVPETPVLLDVARRMVPRYTSYPTAPHFSDAVGPATYAGWLERLAGSAAPVSLYLHIPFCRSICSYCGCTTKAARRDAPLVAYADALIEEIVLVAERIGPAAVSHIHWGGGTPNILPADCLATLAAELATRFRFRDGMEHAIELDPRHVTARNAAALADLGINRVSLGVQTLDEAVQHAIGRVQPFETVAAAFAALRDAGIAAINVDLIYGLPLQGEAALADTAERMLALSPDRLAVFGYAHVPWMRPHQRLIDEKALPGPAARLGQAALMRSLIAAAGYVEIGIDHFARPDDPLADAARAGMLRRNFQGYTDDDAGTLIGLGASAIGRTPSGFVQNAADVAGWRRALAAGRLATIRGKAFSADDLMRAAVIEALLCSFEADLAAIAARHGAAAGVFAGDLARLAPLIDAGWVAVDGGRIAIGEHRHEIARVVASEFDAYLGRGGRHSAAV